MLREFEINLFRAPNMRRIPIVHNSLTIKPLYVFQENSVQNHAKNHCNLRGITALSALDDHAFRRR